MRGKICMQQYGGLRFSHYVVNSDKPKKTKRPLYSFSASVFSLSFLLVA